MQGGYAIVVIVCLSVSNFAQKLPNGFASNFQEGWQWVNEQMIKFWWRSGSGKTCLGGGMYCPNASS